MDCHKRDTANERSVWRRSGNAIWKGIDVAHISPPNEIMPPTLLEHVHGDCVSTQQGQEALNLVIKQLVSVTGHDATVHMTEIVMNEPGVNTTENPNVSVALDYPLVPVTPEHHIGENC